MNLEKIKEELIIADLANNIKKDILIVVHNQLEYFKKCIKSIYKNTDDFNLFIWNNNSNKKTVGYLHKIYKKYNNVKIYNSEKNIGFIIPNNTMIKDAKSDYIILLNSDTLVNKFWDKVLISTLKTNEEIAISGFGGGILDKNGKGCDYAYGEECDYICGYCMCISRQTYEKFGLFDEENLKFAYFEDSDYSLRIKEKNKKIYACYSRDLVYHYQNKTTSELVDKSEFPFFQIKTNNDYFKKRWAKYLSNK